MNKDQQPPIHLEPWQEQAFRAIYEAARPVVTAYPDDSTDPAAHTASYEPGPARNLPNHRETGSDYTITAAQPAPTLPGRAWAPYHLFAPPQHRTDW